MKWRSALFTPGHVERKTSLFVQPAREAHDRITNLLVLTQPALTGVWQFRETTKHFAGLSDSEPVRDAVLSFINFPATETAIKRMDLRESVSKISWERQRDAIAEMTFLVACSVFENFTGALQELVALPSGKGRPIEKGFQFPALSFDPSVSPPTSKASSFKDNWKKALALLPSSAFMITNTLPTFPTRPNGRDCLSDFEMKMQAYLLFKKLRNTIAHGDFDKDIPHQFEVVDKIVNVAALGINGKATISHDGSGEYYVTYYDVVGFVGLLLSIIRDIDFFYLTSEHGESALIDRLKAHRDSRASGQSDKTKENGRLKRTLSSLGANQLKVDDVTRSYFIAAGAWRA